MKCVFCVIELGNKSINVKLLLRGNNPRTKFKVIVVKENTPSAAAAPPQDNNSLKLLLANKIITIIIKPFSGINPVFAHFQFGIFGCYLMTINHLHPKKDH